MTNYELWIRIQLESIAKPKFLKRLKRGDNTEMIENEDENEEI